MNLRVITNNAPPRVAVYVAVVYVVDVVVFRSHPRSHAARYHCSRRRQKNDDDGILLGHHSRDTPHGRDRPNSSALGQLRVPLALRSNRVDRGRRHARGDTNTARWNPKEVDVNASGCTQHADHTGGNVELKKAFRRVREFRTARRNENAGGGKDPRHRPQSGRWRFGVRGRCRIESDGCSWTR